MRKSIMHTDLPESCSLVPSSRTELMRLGKRAWQEDRVSVAYR